MTDIDVRIKEKLQEFDEATKKASEFTAKSVAWPGDLHGIEPVDIFAMGEAFDSEQLKYAEHKLLLAEKFADKFSAEEISFWRGEQVRLQERVNSWKRGEFPKS